MGGRAKYRTGEFIKEKSTEGENSFTVLLQDPERCRHQIIRSKLTLGKSGNYINLIGYLKKMIMSREICAQGKAVKCIISMLIDCKNKDTFMGQEEAKIIITRLLNNDFAEFLCEALPYPSSSSTSDLLLVIYQCLALLSSNDEFFQFHAVYAFESVLRSLHFVCQYVSVNENSGLEKQNQTLSSGLSLIAVILHGSVNKCNIIGSSSHSIEGGSILDRIYKLISATIKLSNLQTKWKSGLVLRSLLNPWHLGDYFHWENENVIESVVKRKVCISKNICTKDKDAENLIEFERRTPLFHGRVQMIHRKSTLEESEIHIHNRNCCGNKTSKSFPLKEIKLILGLLEEIMRALQSCLKGAVISDCYIKPTLTQRFFLLICQIGKNTMQLIPHKIESMFGIESKNRKKDVSTERPLLKNVYFKQIFSILNQPIGELCANILVELECKKSNYELYKEYLICLEMLYLKFGKLCLEISHKLVFQGYLTLMPILLSFQDFRANEAIKTTCQVVLSHLLSQLAEVELNWLNSFNILNQGLSNLPVDLISWPSVLASQSSEPTGLAMLIFSYFYCISSSREELALPFLIPLMQFIKCIYCQSKAGCIAKELSAPMLKALWFSFSISYLSNGCPVNPDIEEASQKLNYLICDFWVKQKNGEISNVFTYHPALLLWVFSSPDRNSWLQLRVVLLWLQGCEPSKPCQELEKLLILNQDAFLCLMEIAEVGSVKVMECALRTLWNCMQKAKSEEKEKISSALWEILLHMMQRFSGLEDDVQRERAINISCLLQLVQASAQSEPSPNATIRLACLLNSAITIKPSTYSHEPLRKNQYILYLSGLKMLHFLLSISLLKEDIQVASSILSNYGLLQRLEWAANLCSKIRSSSASIEKGVDGKSKDRPLNDQFFEDLNSVACLILAKLLLINPFNSQGVVKSFSLNSWHLLHGINSSSEDLCRSSMKLSYTLVQVHVMKPTLVSRPFVKLVGNHSEADCFSDISFIRTLYLQFIMLCAKVTPDLECYCWEFLTLALKLPNKNLTSHLSKLPWNTSLISSKLSLNLVHSSDEKNSGSQFSALSISFLHFVNEWLDNQICENDFTRSNITYTKKNEAMKNVGSMILRKTISKIGKALVIDDCSDESSLYTNSQNKSTVMKETILLVLKFKRDITDALAIELRKKLSALSA